jgi:hypothetical protein
LISTPVAAAGYGRQFFENGSERPWLAHERSWDQRSQFERGPRDALGRRQFEPGMLLALQVNPQELKEKREMMMGVKVFTATKAREREMLGEVVTRWLAENPRTRVVDKIVTQSSDSAFHCLSITLFYSTDD